MSIHFMQSNIQALGVNHLNECRSRRSYSVMVNPDALHKIKDFKQRYKIFPQSCLQFFWGVGYEGSRSIFRLWVKRKQFPTEHDSSSSTRTSAITVETEKKTGRLIIAFNVF